ncbi:helix-turn-helix domain-containing protein [Streptomyces sp. NPDC054804]
MTHSGPAPDAGCPWTCVIIRVLDAERSCGSHGLAQPYDVAARPRRDSQGLPGLRGCSTQVKGSAVTRPRDLPYGESGLEFRWHKRRWWCREAGCPRRSFTEQIPQMPAGARLTARLRGAAGRRIRDAGCTIIQVARDLRLSWPTVMEASARRPATSPRHLRRRSQSWASTRPGADGPGATCRDPHLIPSGPQPPAPPAVRARRVRSRTG